MSTVFQNLRARGTLTVVGLASLATAAITTLTVTSLTSSTGEFTSTLSGATIQINKAGAGSGKLTINGGSGSYVCLRDSDNAGYSMIRALNGTLTTTIAGATMCP